jgi:mono/diheme cytochrome c family protein
MMSFRRNPRTRGWAGFFNIEHSFLESMKRFFKIAGYSLATFVALLAVSYTIIHIRTNTQLSHIYQLQPAPIDIPTDSSAVARGKHIVETHGCIKCHGDNFGGKIFLDNPALGRVVAPNLTSGRSGVQPQYSDSDWIRAIRHGIGVEGKPLLVMPSQDYYFLSDEDLGAVIAFLKQLPAVDNELPAMRVGTLARILYQLGKLDVLIPAAQIAHEAPRPEAPLPGVTPAYGKYIVQGNCQGCHGENLLGGPPLVPGYPPVPNLTKAGPLAKWQENDFIKALRTGRTPEGKQMNGEFMPWLELGQMNDTELRAMWAYLQILD